MLPLSSCLAFVRIIFGVTIERETRKDIIAYEALCSCHDNRRGMLRYCMFTILRKPAFCRRRFAAFVLSMRQSFRQYFLAAVGIKSIISADILLMPMMRPTMRYFYKFQMIFLKFKTISHDI